MNMFRNILTAFVACMLAPCLTAAGWAAPKGTKVAKASPTAKDKKEKEACDRSQVKELLADRGQLVRFRERRKALKLKLPKSWHRLTKRCRMNESTEACYRRLSRKCRAMFGDMCVQVTMRTDDHKNYLLRYRVGEQEYRRHVASKEAGSAYLLELRKRGYKVIMLSLKPSTRTHVSGVLKYASEWNRMSIPRVRQLEIQWRPKDIEIQALKRLRRKLRQGVAGWHMVLYRPVPRMNLARLRLVCQLKPVKGAL